jgi:uncharacterized membrane protein YoaK (UPF0700 family)
VPSKVNPTQQEAMVMVCLQVIGEDSIVAAAGAQGNFELNAMRPVIINNVLHSARILGDAAEKLRRYSVERTELDRTKVDGYVGRSLMLVTAHLVTGSHVGVSRVVSVPVFMAGLVVARVLVAGLDVRGVASLRPLLLLQFTLLAGFLTLALATHAHANPDAAAAVVAAMLGVSAMATQNALVEISIRGAPSTAVMMTNITRFTMDAGEALLGRDPGAVAAARRRASHTWPAIVGFASGAAVGAGLYAGAGLASLALPMGFALVALAIASLQGMQASRKNGVRHSAHALTTSPDTPSAPPPPQLPAARSPCPTRPRRCRFGGTPWRRHTHPAAAWASSSASTSTP